MHAIQVARPFHHDGWVYEEKVDGYRMVAVKSNAGREHHPKTPADDEAPQIDRPKSPDDDRVGHARAGYQRVRCRQGHRGKTGPAASIINQPGRYCA